MTYGTEEEETVFSPSTFSELILVIGFLVKSEETPFPQKSVVLDGIDVEDKGIDVDTLGTEYVLTDIDWSWF